MIIQPTTPDTSSKLQPKDSRMAMKHRTASGFTIVELLIVIVIIAILAAITIVAYSGIQQRAQNSAIISAAEQTYKLIEGYIGANDAYPLTGAPSIDACITVQSGCGSGPVPVSSYPPSPVLTAALQTIGNPPTSIPTTKTMLGIDYNYLVSRTADGKAQPVVLQYFLLGSNQQCGLSGIVNQTWAVMTTQSGNTATRTLDGITKTMCVVTVPGPSA